MPQRKVSPSTEPLIVDRDLLIWAAGFFDGEGCVSIGKATNRKKDRKTGVLNGKVYVGYHMHVIVCQKEIEALQRFHAMFGGSLVEFPQYGYMYYLWKVWGTSAKDVLCALLPYLVVKRKVAENAIRFQEMLDVRPKTHQGEKRSPEFVAASEMLYFQSKMLNERNKISKIPKGSVSQKTIVSTASTIQ